MLGIITIFPSDTDQKLAEIYDMKLIAKDFGHLFEVAFTVRKPWKLSEMTISKVKRSLGVAFDFYSEENNRCPFCGVELIDMFYPISKQWGHLNFFQYAYKYAGTNPSF